VQLLATNDRIIKLWRLDNKVRKKTNKAQVVDNSIVLPVHNVVSSGFEGVERK
jgi:hypothetical protein